MGKFFFRVGNLLMISRRHRSVRRAVIFLFKNFLILAGLIFTLEIVLILLGASDIILPIPFLSGDFLIDLLF